MGTWSNSDLDDLCAYFEEALDWEFDVEEFDDRLKMQKLVYFAREFGLDVPYNYNIYRYGPYSPSLADDYYNLSNSGSPKEGAKGIATTEFEELVNNRENGWLEVAATIHKIRGRFEGMGPDEDVRRKVVKRVSNMKEKPEDEVDSIYSDLENSL